MWCGCVCVGRVGNGSGAVRVWCACGAQCARQPRSGVCVCVCVVAGVVMYVGVGVTMCVVWHAYNKVCKRHVWGNVCVCVVQRGHNEGTRRTVTTEPNE